MKTSAGWVVVLAALMLSFSSTTFSQQFSASCPLKLLKVDLTPVSSFAGPTSWPKGNQEMVLRVRYKNTSARQIQSARILVETFLNMEGPNHNMFKKNTREVVLPDTVLPGKKNTTRLRTFSGFGSPRAWLQEVAFADGSKWTSTNPPQCSYGPKDGYGIQVATPIAISRP